MMTDEEHREAEKSMDELMMFVIPHTLLGKYKDWDQPERQELLTTLGQTVIDRCKSLSMDPYRFEKQINIELRDLQHYRDPDFLKALGEQIIKKASEGATEEDHRKAKIIKQVFAEGSN
jgi:hypothetical protein